MSATICTQNSRTRRAAPAQFPGVALLLAGALLGYGLGVGGGPVERPSAAPGPTAAAEDWHGNVMRSQGPN